MEETKDKIIKCLNKISQSISSRDLLKRVKANKNDYYKALEELEKEGKITLSKSRRIRKVREKSTVDATIVSLSKGFAFARPESGGNDIFIHADHLKSAFIKDKVRLYRIRQSPKGPSGEVDSISEKSSRIITGTLNKGRGTCEMVPDDAIRYPIRVVQNVPRNAKNGDKVQAKISRQKNSSELQAEIVKIYGKSNSAKICADAILDQYGIRTKFEKEILEEAKRASSAGISEKDLKGRLDLRKLAICTIDGAGAKDLDDAVSVSKTQKGFRLGVHIADVSHYVREGGALDQEAFERGTSVYFADRVVPMLPEELSNGACSLNAGEDKLTFSAIIDLSSRGEILSYRFRKSVICSRVRGVYSEVNQLFSGQAGRELKKKYSPVIRSLHAAKELAEILKKRSGENGSFDIESTESEFTLDEKGVCVDVRPRKSGEAEQMIEQLMITANQAAAKLAKSKGIPFVYRVHEQPDPERVQTLIQLVEAVGLNSRTLKKKGELTAADFAAVLDQAKDTPIQKIISHQLLRTMAKARYDSQPIGHFGLALEDYCHFTSPIRRYPDLAIHRILTALLLGKDASQISRFQNFAAGAAKASSNAEVRAMAAERDTEDCYMAEYAGQHIGEIYDGVISGVTQRGIFVELANTVEGFVPVDSFQNAAYQFDGMITQVDRNTGHKLTIGQPLRIQVAAADVAGGRIDFIPCENPD
ncbi:Ribonuclease R [Caprobacter fermentans]|uniref:Ribonuclease R n=1 Tax=Caproicibacter fermentans TaxID=2576756 RepID=A0A6N8I4G4_9FIRM|nr:ribonuclease R [Caproicibacter fermentans]MVB12859.1 Ribonuclease R [Caproicibacter fermentans]OCN02346.1 ribonuclease R [Clostridium sp. W14A]QNK41384.1 ribonuclease R [Caproicibacter fermentans]